jgi:S-DNA-T family DNA segregation ATPase FtsK/SpoIIIE
VPEFLAPAGEREAATRELIPDEGAILAALKDLGIPKYREKLKEGWQPRWPLPTVLDGKGYRTQLELPRGVNVEMINKKRDLLAHNLVRLPVEVWPTEPQNQPGVLDLWVAHQGLLSGPVAPYPHLKDGACDYFKGVPVGTDQRGQVLTGRLMACNYAIGGTMGSGKSSLVLNLVTGAALDPLVDIDVYVMAYNVDYDPFKDRLSTLVKGDEDEHITAAMDGLRELREEVTKRGKLLDSLGGEETKVTRALAKKDARLRPRLVVLDECQELFRHEKYGEQAKQLAIKVMTKARKCAITLVWVTPEPSADSLPRELAKIVSHGVCFAIGDYQGNDAILGTGAYKRGISAVDLDPQENIGTAMAFGFAGRPGLLRSFYIRKDASADELSPIARRSLDSWRGAAPLEPDEVRDLVQDVHEALGEHDKVKATDVAARLRELAPAYRPYRSLNGTRLGQWLCREGVLVRDDNGVLMVRADRVLAELDRRQGVGG